VRKLIIDTDPGVDDALAILLAVKAKCNIIGITTVYGNSSVADSSRNALSILELCSAPDIPVYQGAKKPLVGVATRANSHGDKGLGGFSMATDREIKETSAIDFLIQTLESENVPIDIMAIGPLTNIAELIRKRPDLLSNINQIVIMGGVFGEKGNITEYAEFNAYNDPVAFDDVLSSAISKVIIPADVCRTVTFELDLSNRLKGTTSEYLKKITQEYVNYYKNDEDFGGFSGAVMYDLLATAYLIDPSLFVVSSKKIRIKLEGHRKGLTEENETGDVCKVAESVNSDSIKKLFIDFVESNNSKIGEKNE